LFKIKLPLDYKKLVVIYKHRKKSNHGRKKPFSNEISSEVKVQPTMLKVEAI
jgi:hypothetical protein